jgi:hypothetical protein
LKLVESSSSVRKPSGFVRVPPLEPLLPEPLLPEPAGVLPLDEPELEPEPFSESIYVFFRQLGSATGGATLEGLAELTAQSPLAQLEPHGEHPVPHGAQVLE